MALNKIEKALIHALFVHLHHNIDQVVDFKAIEQLNRKVSRIWPGALIVGPGDDAAVFQMPGIKGSFVAKMESHCSPCVPRPYDAAATAAGGAMRDVVAMGARPIFLLNFVGTRPPEEKVIVGPCGFSGKCRCGKCAEMTSKERLDLIMKGIRDMCETMGVFILGGGLSTSFSDIVPATVVAVIGKLVTEKSLTKPAKAAGDKIIIIGETDNDGNDTLFRAGLVKEMRPAIALFKEEIRTMQAALAAFETGKIKACSDLGAAGIGAAVCESARYGGFGAKVNLAKVPLKRSDITPEEILICETQARMALQVSPEDVEEVMEAIKSKDGIAEIIGEITEDQKEIFEYNGKTVAVIPNKPSKETLEELK
ncbi:MAG: AIR synthase-related protein [Candidatus Thermoplasmatota archaeon]|nr:AIR synthase-related protein [Candidatus Thermoplasmatota archaeon]MDI6855378.1 AIR synthase-related protein [Candidatus Thermoplasmatota archaeon]